jgi:hypothetical protein
MLAVFEAIFDAIAEAFYYLLLSLWHLGDSGTRPGRKSSLPSKKHVV